MERHKRFIMMGVIVVSLGVVFTTVLRQENGSLGIVLIAFGGLLFIVGMRLKKKTDHKS